MGMIYQWESDLCVPSAYCPHTAYTLPPIQYKHSWKLGKLVISSNKVKTIRLMQPPFSFSQCRLYHWANWANVQGPETKWGPRADGLLHFFLLLGSIVTTQEIVFFGPNWLSTIENFQALQLYLYSFIILSKYSPLAHRRARFGN